MSDVTHSPEFVTDQKWCGQSQPHYAHLWSEGGPLNRQRHACAGYAGVIDVTSQPVIDPTANCSCRVENGGSGICGCVRPDQGWRC